MDPLEQLKANHTGDAIHNYPLAYGWWILLFITIALVVWGIKTYLKYRKQCQAKKQALKALEKDSLSSEQVFNTIKWAALQYFPRSTIASLTGEHLKDFLASVLPEKQQEKFINLIQAPIDNRYLSQEKDADGELSEAAVMWVKNALPPKKAILNNLAINEKAQPIGGNVQ